MIDRLVILGATGDLTLPFTAQPVLSEPPDCARPLLDVLLGNAALSIRGDEAQEDRRVLAPVTPAWPGDMVTLAEHPAASDGPAPVRSS
ncbi:hypothetical protein FE391_27070 [Nonomuraea sp. KC401]|uniref:hypothetical protein n=1 Tax=Nonomuraea sp. K271 TaxID=1848319 RepID=UPI0010FE04DD|nr:hypothetical protein [Nonomuraea sp. K271]NBE96003.1 hypothetical protein [Nonomuraea sp. K271]TLF64928.1 hypothetical protein FE391_27070 [Nonomuraea sp. KC401]